MSLVYMFRPTQMSTQKYDECIRRLAAAGAGNPPGRTYHVCFGKADDLRVMDVWESKEAFERFGQTLLPILKQLGVDPGAPEVIPVHNIIRG